VDSGASVTDRRVSLPTGVSLRVVDRAPGPTGPGGRSFVLVHGLASSLHLWDGVAVRLHGAGHRVVQVDLRGHGGSDKPEHGYDTPMVAGDVEALIGALGLERPVVAGQSWGGNVVVELAARRPGLVAGVVCVDGGVIELAEVFPDWSDCEDRLAPPRLEGTPAERFESWIRRAHPDWPEEGIRGALATMEVLDDGTVRPWLARHRHLAILRGLWEHRPSQRLPHIEEPILIIPADDGTASPWTLDKRAAVERAAALGRRVRVEWFSPAHHDVHAQHPGPVADLLDDAVRSGWC
jgi:pimeloyl-ACP methyl ester carboxylesterase